MMKSPIFIVGANRSGTTLLRLILNAHARIAIPEELGYFRAYPYKGVHLRKWRAPGLSSAHYTAFLNHFLATNCRPLEGLDLAQIRHEILSGEQDLKRPYQMVLEAWARLHGKARWGEKTPGNLFYADIIVEMFPDAKFIHMVRDPRAGVCSMLETSIFPNDIVFNALNRHKHMTEGRVLLERHVPAEQRIIIRYEDLVTYPVSTVQAICDFIGEAFEPEMLRYYEDASRYMKSEAAAEFNAAATRPISSTMKDKWRRRLAPAEVATIEKICAAEMQEFGYELEGHGLGLWPWLNLTIKTAYWNYRCRRKRHLPHFTVQYEMFSRSRQRLRSLSKRVLPLQDAVPDEA